MRLSACSSLRRARTWGGMMTSSGFVLARSFCQWRQTKYEARAMPSAPSTHQSQNQPLGISTGALMSRMSAASEFVAALLVVEDGAGTMTAEEFVFIVIRDGGAFPAFQKICPARWRKAGPCAVEWSRCWPRGTI